MQVSEQAGHPGSVGLGAKTGAWYENVLLVLLAVAAGMVFLDRLGIVFVFPQIKHDLKLDHAQLGMLMGVVSLTWAVSAIGVSFLSDALGGRAKIIIIICMIGFSFATGLVAFTSTFASLLAMRAVAGLFFGPSLPLMQSVMAKSSSPHRLGFNLGLVITGVAAGSSALPPLLMIVLAGAVGWHNTFLCLAAPGIILAVVLAVVMKPDAAPGPAGGAAGEAVPRLKLREALSVLTNRNIGLALIGGAALIGFLPTFISFAPLFLVQDTAISPTLRTVALTALGLAGAAGSIFAPALSDRLPRKTCTIATTGCTMLLPLFFVLARAHHGLFPVVLALQFVAGGAMTMVVFIIPGETVPHRLAATTFALLLAVGELVGGFPSPALAGVLSDHYGLPWALWFCCGLGGLSLLAALAMREPPRRAHRAITDAPLGVVGESMGI